MRSSSTRSLCRARNKRGFDFDMALIDRRMLGVERVLGSGGEINRFVGCRNHLADGERQQRLDGGVGALDGSLTRAAIACS